MPKPVSRFLQVWLNWKALRLPWRKQFLIGHDLDGNTYWEFRDVRGHNDSATARWRRIVQYPRGTHHSQVQVPPQWHQWLRHTRRDPPSLAEQRHEVARQQQMRILAAAADARWAGAKRVDGSSPSFVVPGLPAAAEAAEAEAAEAEAAEAEAAAAAQLQRPEQQQQQQQQQQEEQPPAPARDPWTPEQRGIPGQEWQPQAWTPKPKQ